MRLSVRCNTATALLAVLVIICTCVASVVSVVTNSTKTAVTFDKLPHYQGIYRTYTSYVGYLNVRPEIDGHLFYWFFPAQKNVDTAPLILWLNGGPGCSSMVGAFFEHGPISMISATRLEDNPNSWTDFASVLYIDQPLGAGLTYLDTQMHIPNNSYAAAQDTFVGLQEWYQLFPEYRTRKLWLAGESYAGKYIPLIATRIVEHNRAINNTADPRTISQLAGLMLGNAMFQPSIQFRTYGRHMYAAGISDYQTLVLSRTKYRECMELLSVQKFDEAASGPCKHLFLDPLHAAGRIKPFDYREFSHPNQFKDLTTYLTNPAVTKVLKLSEKTRFHHCLHQIHVNFVPEFHADLPSDVLASLFSGLAPVPGGDPLRVLLFNGQFDLRVSVAGTHELLRMLPWSGRQAFTSLLRTHFIVNGKVAGVFKTWGPLTYAVVYGAGHMSPRDQPASVHWLASQFVGSKSLCPPGTQCDQSIAAVPKGSPKESGAGCPSGCSHHGRCDAATNQCICDSGYSSFDCGVASLGYDFSDSDTRNAATTRGGRAFNGSMDGQLLHLYSLTIPPHIASIDLHILANRTTLAGNLYVFVNVSGASPAASSLESLRAVVEEEIALSVNTLQPESQSLFNIGSGASTNPSASPTVRADQIFVFSNVTHSGRTAAELVLSGVSTRLYNDVRSVIVGIYNSANSPAAYELAVVIRPASPQVNVVNLLIGLIIVLALFAALLVSVITYRLFNRSKYDSFALTLTDLGGDEEHVIAAALAREHAADAEAEADDIEADVETDVEAGDTGQFGPESSESTVRNRVV